MEPIRILQVVTYMNRGGLETMLMNYYRKIDKDKIQFDFLTHRNFQADYDDEIEKMGGRIYHLPVLNPFSLKYRIALRKFFKQHKEYQIIHVHQDCMSSLILKEAKKCGVKIRIAHSHSSNQDKNFKYLIKMYYKKFISKYATSLFACSKEAGEWMFNCTNFRVLNNAIDSKNYIYSEDMNSTIRKEFGIRESTLVVGHIGRFSYPKNHMFLLDIFKEITKQVEAVLVLVGDGELREEIEKKIEQLNLKDNVILTGVRSDVDNLLQMMDVFVFPSIYEGLPVTLIEAQAAGVPCLISDKVPIECKKTNLVYQKKLDEDIKIWASQTIKLSSIKKRDTYEEIKEGGYDIEENAEQLADFYFKMEKSLGKL